MAKKQGYWGYAPDSKSKVPDYLKKKVQTKADDLVEKVPWSHNYSP